MATWRSWKRRSAVTVAAVAGSTVLLLSGCSDTGGKDDKASPTAKASDGGHEPEAAESSAADQTIATARDGDIAVTIRSAVREEGGFLTISGQVTNNGSRAWMGQNWQSEETELASNGGSLAGASLVDNTGKKRYLVLRDTNGRCLCTKFPRIQAGDSADWYAQFPAPPADTEKVDFQVGTMPPVPIEIAGE